MFKKCNKFVIVGKPQPSGKKKLEKRRTTEAYPEIFGKTVFSRILG